ncbi:MAG: FAD-dependent oxidoreductase [Caulobacteraceae bacterium]
MGGRAHTLVAEGFPIDLGCGWLHSADANPFSRIARGLGMPVEARRLAARRPRNERSTTSGDPRSANPEIGP